MKHFLLAVFILLSTNAFSQYSLTGKIEDTETKKPIEFCSVILFHNEKILLSTQTTQSGSFRFDNVKKGKYEVELRYIGYTTYKARVTLENDLDMGIIALTPNTFTLEGVEVIATKKNVIYKLDKNIISANSNIAANVGGTASDILSKIPSMRVDIDGNVSFRGSTGFIIQVNGKPSMFNASQALQQIPVNLIENIEIITVPSARNETGGDAGIINIITKQKYSDGLSGVFNIFGNSYGSRGADFTINKQTGEQSFRFGGIYGQRIRKSDFEQKKTTIIDDISVTSYSKGPRKGESYSYIVQGGWQLTKPHSNYYIDLTGGYEGHKNNGDLQYSELTSKQGSTTASSNYNSRDNFDIHETLFACSTGFNHEFNDNGHTLKAHFYLKYGGNALERFESDLYNNSGIHEKGHRADEAEHRWTVDGRVDYVLPYNSTGRIESGYRYNSYLEEGDYTMYYWNPNTNQLDYRDDIYNTFYFQEGVNALYFILNQRFSKFEFQPGVRVEHTHRVLRSSIEGANRTFNRLELFPSAHIAYNPNQSINITAAYSRRTNRPGIWYMEPYITFRDYYTAEIGNPDIKPEYINSFELSFKKTINEQTLHAALFHRSRTDKIERLRIPYEAGITLDSMANVGNDYSTGIEIGLNIKTGKIWNFTLNGDAYHYKVKNKLKMGGKNESSTNFGISLNNNIQIAKNTVVQLDGTYVGATVRTQGKQEGFFYADFGIRQQFFNRQLAAGLSFRNFLNTAQYKSNIDTYNLNSHTVISPKYPLLTLNLVYTFNNYKQREKGREGSDFFEGTNY